MEKHMRRQFSILLFVGIAGVGKVYEAHAQGFANCSRLIAPNGSVTWICPPAAAQGGQWRGGEFIPACPPGMAFSRDTHQCLPAQNVGGVIPCSPDDKTYIPGRGWVSNCR
jgi:hypothetical protein